ncbi:MAG: hypothetical protein F6K42_22810 [Leptolyngbya sp. SIO1D8]|nr:hypothetical protein [Leptolyngbya sp. SIO1D8]
MENPLHKAFFTPNMIWDGYISFLSTEESASLEQFPTTEYITLLAKSHGRAFS